jgi:hypothetical protein
MEMPDVRIAHYISHFARLNLQLSDMFVNSGFSHTVLAPRLFHSEKPLRL